MTLMAGDPLLRELGRLLAVTIAGPRSALVVLDEVADLRARLIAGRNQIAREAASLDRGLGAARAYGAAAQSKRIGR
jgi:hypothetical protein